MRYLILIFLLILALVLPGTVFHLWSWSGIKPDLVMLFAIYVALHDREWTGILWGTGAGLLQDFYLGHYLGMYSVSLTVVALITSWLAGRWYRDNFPLTVLLVFLVTASGQLVIGFLGLGAGLHWSGGDILRIVGGIAIYNALLVPITYPWIHRSFLHGWLRYRPKYER